MPALALTVLAPDGATVVPAEVDGDAIWLDPDVITAVTGWAPKPEGLCRGDACVPVRDPAARDDRGRLDLVRVAAALHRPLALDHLADTTVVALGEAAHERAAAYADGMAPRLELPDLDGVLHTVPDHGRRKRLLLAWSSW